MGMITYYELVEDGNPAREGFDIDKSYFELSEGLKRLGLNGLYIVSGDDGSYAAEADDQYEVELSPAAVAKNWEKLREVTFEQFLAAYKETDIGKSRRDEPYDYIKAHFTTLKLMYETAAGGAAGIKIGMC